MLDEEAAKGAEGLTAAAGGQPEIRSPAKGVVGCSTPARGTPLARGRDDRRCSMEARSHPKGAGD